MTDSYNDIIARLMPLYEKAPERFMKFYDAVYLMCHELPEGSRFRIADRCAEKSVPLFRDLVALCIMDEPYDAYRGMLELSEDREWVRRGIGINPRRKPSAWAP